MKFQFSKQFPSIFLIVAFSVAVGASEAKADNAPGVTYRTVTGAEPYKRDLKNLEYHLIDTGHFALETHGQEIADLMRDFLKRQIQSPLAAN